MGVNAIAYATFKPRPRADKPAFSPRDVTVIIPTVFSNVEEVTRCLGRILRNNPAKVIVVTAQGKVAAVNKCLGLECFRGVEVIGVPQLNKRQQMIAALREVNTEIVVFADDDVFWPSSTYLDYLLACFEEPGVGAAGTRQRVRRNARPNLWNFLGICYLERRNFNTGATNHIDGGISTLSGRTSAWRSCILKNHEFYYYFMNDAWFGRPLNTDDDKCLTRWAFSNGWKIALQFDDRAILETTLEDNPKFLHQCIRWARAHWRGNLTVMSNNTYWCSVPHLWTFYAIYISQFQTPALLVDGGLTYLLYCGLQDYSLQTRSSVLTVFIIWVLFTKIVKLIPHILRHPEDVIFLPASVLFSYLHGFINIYALFTLHVTCWGSRKLEDDEKLEKKITMPIFEGLDDSGDDSIVVKMLDPALITPLPPLPTRKDMEKNPSFSDVQLLDGLSAQ